jgi:hypothetical protein
MCEAQVEEHLPSQHKALSSNLSTTHTRKYWQMQVPIPGQVGALCLNTWNRTYSGVK